MYETIANILAAHASYQIWSVSKALRCLIINNNSPKDVRSTKERYTSIDEFVSFDSDKYFINKSH